MIRIVPCVALALLAASCAAAPRDGDHPPASIAEQRVFLDGLRGLCGNAYEGSVVHAPETDDAFTGRRLVMHVAECSDGMLRIPFHVGSDRSRTWFVRTASAGLELKHVHRHEDGTESSNTNYGGTTSARGTPHRQEFPADAVSVAAVPARGTQWWFLEHYPGRIFAYGLFREGSGLLYRIEFDLTSTVPPPPAPW
ncbi:MAG TPA: hypothetical protein VK936_09565 [Longimicrobiales bacterium]|nr:hypothetical protein [Longimicrobiales bacterium]